MQPQDAYGLEKLASEELAIHYSKDFGIECRVARFHNIYGPYGTWKGGREKAPAAFCRKVLTSKQDIEMWGDGKQTRSFTYIDDCVEGVLRITKSDCREPLNLGSSEMVRCPLPPLHSHTTFSLHSSIVCVSVAWPRGLPLQLRAGLPCVQATQALMCWSM